MQHGDNVMRPPPSAMHPMMQKIAERAPHHCNVMWRPCGQQCDSGQALQPADKTSSQLCSSRLSALRPSHGVVSGRHDALAPLTPWCSDSTSRFVVIAIAIAISIAITVQDPPQRHFGTRIDSAWGQRDPVQSDR